MIKKFQAATTREALRMVRDALGADAIILSNRPVAGGVEIIAVADVDMVALTGQAEPALALGRPPTAPPQSRPAFEPQHRPPAQEEEPTVIRPARRAARGNGTPAGADAPMAAQAPTGGRAGDPAPPAGASATELVRELRALRAVVEGQLAGFAWGHLAAGNPVRPELFKRLLAAGFSPAFARQTLAELPAGLDVQQAMKWLKSLIAPNLPIAGEGEDLLQAGGVYALVGPTGVGKTTTVAKLAARAVLRHGAGAVALVTTDAYRIGAQDQLRIYGRILGTPVYAVQDDDDLALTLADLARKHLVLIDTVGMSQRDQRVAEQVALLSGQGRPVKRLLLLGAPAQGMTLEEVVRAYSGPGLIGCILTKLDEALSFGPCLDVVIRHQLKVFYLTNGQRVPEDLHPANALYLVDRAFRLAQTDSPYVPEEGDYPVLMAAMDRAGLPVDAPAPGLLEAGR
ncbi:MAG: flagellar biosynthesis protein FlhF [Thiobacillaceae bacterium]|nr:flagellar biosynthesis protein FlhF [Thiobacillaceae bacterium]